MGFDDIAKIVRICTEYEKILDAIAYKSDPDTYTKQSVAASILLVLMYEIVLALFFGALLYGLLSIDPSNAAPNIDFGKEALQFFRIWLGSLAFIMAIGMVRAPIEATVYLIREKDCLAKALNEGDVKRPDTNEGWFAHAEASFYRSVRNIRRDIFGDFNPLFSKGYAVATSLADEIVSEKIQDRPFSNKGVSPTQSEQAY